MTNLKNLQNLYLYAYLSVNDELLSSDAVSNWMPGCCPVYSSLRFLYPPCLVTNMHHTMWGHENWKRFPLLDYWHASVTIHPFEYGHAVGYDLLVNFHCSMSVTAFIIFNHYCLQG